jgi:hypothetical protein
VPRLPNKDELPHGRPLFQRELNKVGPAPDNYDIKREIGRKANPKQACLFGNSYQKYRKVSNEI